MAVALKILYRNQVNPIREIILDGIERAVRYNNPNAKVDFKDFPEEKLDTTANTNPATTQEGVIDINKPA